MTETLTGTDRSAGISYDELFDNDTHPVSDVLRRVGEHLPGNTRVPARVYYAHDVHDLEVERLWSRAWQLACLAEEIPCQWDFPEVDMADYGLPEALVDTWHGFVFINPDRDAAPLADYLGDLADHFEFVPFERRYKAAHVSKLMEMNWKTCQEAFMESYHVVATHPPPEVTNVRGWLADRKRSQVRRQVGDAVDVEAVSDAELIDSIFFSVFPNWSPWGCFNPIMYRFRPNGDNPRSASSR